VQTLTAIAVITALVSTAAAQRVPARPAELPVSRLDAPQGTAPPAPRQAPPPRTGQLPTLPVTRLDERGRSADLDGPRTLSMTFSQHTPIRDVLVLLVRGTTISVVADDSAAGSFSGELKDLTLRQALEAVLFPSGLDYDVHGSLIRVFPRRPLTRLFEIDYLNVRRAFERRVHSAADAAGKSTATDVTVSAGADLFDEISAGVAALLSPSGRSHVDRKAGLVQVTDFADRVNQVGVYLDAIHLRATRQVRLQARVLEVILFVPGAALDWRAIAVRAGVAPSGSAGQSATAGMRVPDFNALMAAIAEQGSVRTIASPETVSLNNEPAVIRVATDGVSFGGGTDGSSLISEGLTLTVIPQIAADGLVQLSVSPTYAKSAASQRLSRAGFVPRLTLSETDSLVRVQEGETIVLSGLLQARTETKAATGFSAFFRGVEERSVRSELVILLTPTVVTTGASAAESAR
jgi:MSHA biogenesis protein MshL